MMIKRRNKKKRCDYDLSCLAAVYVAECSLIFLYVCIIVCCRQQASTGWEWLPREVETCNQVTLNSIMFRQTCTFGTIVLIGVCPV